MGSVYIVDQLSTGAQRALKLMHAMLADDPDMRRRFEIEARVGARIESEHIAKVMAAGVDHETGQPWLVMELLIGEDLHAYSKRRGPLEPAEVVAIFEQLCHALGAAHRANIVHRDLKPDNVFLATVKKVGTPYEVKVLDFGIAKVAAEAFSANTAAMGSPSWMSPEQTQLGVDITPATDVWALGLIAFRLLTGKYFWRSSNERGASSETLLREVALEPIPPATMRAAEYGATVPVAFDPWFARCVARDPHERFRDAREAWEALRAALPAGAGGVSIAQEMPTSAQGAARSRPPSMPPPTPIVSQPPPTPIVSQPPAPPAKRTGGTMFGVLATFGVALGLVIIVWSSGILRRKSDPPLASAAPPPVSVAIAATSAPTPPPEPLGDLKDDVEMVRIDGGKFSMGAADGEEDERPVHPVILQPFLLDKTEVTAKAYKRCVDEHRCSAPPMKAGCNYGTAGRENHPINCVDWEQASTYCKAHGKRLPTEEEWEFSARGPKGIKYPWGKGAPASQACWNGDGNSVGKNKRESTCEVGVTTGDRSPFGILDLGGNVSEWTATVYCNYPLAKCTSPTRVVRGGSWADIGAASLRTTYRNRANPPDQSGNIGFRCAQTP